MTTTITQTDAEAHEALVTRTVRLLRQAEAVSSRRPDEPVSPAVAALAADLLFEARRFAKGAAALPMPAPTHVGLAAQLGQALAQLEAFEALHTVWDARFKAFVWRLSRGRVQPVARLRQPVTPPSETRDSHTLRDLLAKRMQAKFEEEYERGYAAGKAEREGAAG